MVERWFVGRGITSGALRLKIMKDFKYYEVRSCLEKCSCLMARWVWKGRRDEIEIQIPLNRAHFFD